jgi:hypothetical protein
MKTRVVHMTGKELVQLQFSYRFQLTVDDIQGSVNVVHGSDRWVGVFCCSTN